METLKKERAQVEAAKAADAAPLDALELLRQQREGGFAFDLSKKIGEVVNGVKAERRAGSVTIKLTFTPAARGDASKLLVRDEIKPNAPEPESAPSLFFTTEEGGLTRENPLQRSFRDVAPEAGFPETER